jgi:medium-chain acyl-[acyl-carrier-protein] hydrolase
MNRATWYRVLAPRPAARGRLIILPHAGGGPAYFRDWAAALPDWLELVAVQLPGRGARMRDAAYPHLTPLMAELLPALQPLMDRPLVLFGHSLGAVIAFELARQWCDTGLPVRGLAVGGSAAPPLPRMRRPLSTLGDRELRDQLARLGGTPADVQGNDEWFHLFAPTLRADLQVLESYAYRPGSRLPIPVWVSGGTRDGWADADALLAWAGDCGRPPAVTMYPGGHFYYSEQRDAFLTDLAGFAAAAFGDAPSARLCVPKTGAVDLYRLDLDALAEDSDARARLLTGEESQRAARLIRPLHRARFIAGRAALRTLLARYGDDDADPGDIPLRTTVHGKPLLDATANPHDLRFNLSHTEGVGLLAVTARADVGVDVETVRPALATDDLARRYFSAREVGDLTAMPDRGRRFFAYWSAKEAYIKARGLGLNIPLDAFDVPLDAGAGPFAVTDRQTPSESGRWGVYPVNVADGLAAAVACREPVRRFRLYRYPEARPRR